MARRKEYGPKRSPFRILLYLIVVVVLLAGIGFLVKYTKQKKDNFAEQIKALNEDERLAMETEAATESKKQAGLNEMENQTEVQTDTETETETETEETEILDKHILVLNATGQDGIAGQWKNYLEGLGYEQVSVASYPESVIEQTVIYNEKKENVTELEKLFSNPNVTEASFSTDMIAEEDGNFDNVDIYIVIGTNDQEV